MLYSAIEVARGGESCFHVHKRGRLARELRVLGFSGAHTGEMAEVGKYRSGPVGSDEAGELWIAGRT